MRAEDDAVTTADGSLRVPRQTMAHAKRLAKARLHAARRTAPRRSLPLSAPARLAAPARRTLSHAPAIPASSLLKSARYPCTPQGLREIAAALEAAPHLVDVVADDMGDEFASERLPPTPSLLPPPGPLPTLESTICCRAKVRET